MIMKSIIRKVVKITLAVILFCSPLVATVTTRTVAATTIRQTNNKKSAKVKISSKSKKNKFNKRGASASLRTQNSQPNSTREDWREDWMPSMYTEWLAKDLISNDYWRGTQPMHVVTFITDSDQGNSFMVAVKDDDWVPMPGVDLTRTGYVFDGWFEDNGGAYDFSRRVKTDLTLYGHWTPL